MLQMLKRLNVADQLSYSCCGTSWNLSSEAHLAVPNYIEICFFLVASLVLCTIFPFSFSLEAFTCLFLSLLFSLLQSSPWRSPDFHRFFHVFAFSWTFVFLKFKLFVIFRLSLVANFFITLLGRDLSFPSQLSFYLLYSSLFYEF